MEKNVISLENGKITVSAAGVTKSAGYKKSVLPRGTVKRLAAMWRKNELQYRLSYCEHKRASGKAAYEAFYGAGRNDKHGFICAPVVYRSGENRAMKFGAHSYQRSKQNVLPVFLATPDFVGGDDKEGESGLSIVFFDGKNWRAITCATIDEEWAFNAIAAMIAYILNGARAVNDVLVSCEGCPYGWEEAGGLSADDIELLLSAGIIGEEEI